GDPQRWQNETYPIQQTAIPPIIDPEQWERVQAKLKHAADLNNRGGPRRTDAEATSTLLDYGYIRCAECNGRMTRHWVKKSKHPYYRCHKNADRPGLPHKMFHVPAHRVDALALKLLAKALTDPEQVLALADAAEQQAADASVDADLAASELAASHKRLSEITAEQDALLAAQAALSRVPGMDKQIQDIRGRLAQLDKECEQANEESTRAIPRRDHANERAEFLRHIFTQHKFWLHVTTGDDGIEDIDFITTDVLDDAGKPILAIREEIVLANAARLLNVPEEDAEALLPVRPLSQYGDELADGTYEVLLTEYFVRTVDVIELLLRRAPHERVRKLLHDLDAVMMVKRGRNWAEYAEHGPIPLEDRVYLQLLGTVQVGTDVTTLNTSS
ncbi:MAG TPA: zinc ribbon domain-containing protein, partial [Ktedonobacterales bacterium]|nr:zinc ribbon domain-containing protein [Ktedonobacterales bacterium]